MTDWDDLGDWWAAEVASDPAYGEQVVPLLLEALRPQAGSRYLDLGCGEGSVMRAVGESGACVVGCDINQDLLRRTAPVVRARLPELNWLAAGSIDGAYAVLVIEHMPDVAALFVAARRVVRRGGTLVVVSNHPAFTPPGAGPLVDPADGEALWRWGPYLAPGASQEPAGERAVTFHHRPLGALLSAAAEARWALEWLAERGVGEEAAARDPLLAAQRHIPRLFAARWQAG